MQASEKSWNVQHADCRIIVPYTSPESVPRHKLFEMSPTADVEPINLCVANMCQVVECPQLDMIRERASASDVPFERILGGNVHSGEGWHIHVLEKPAAAGTQQQRQSIMPQTAGVETTMQVLLRLSSPAVLSHFRIVYTFKPLSSTSRLALSIVTGPSMLHLDAPPAASDGKPSMLELNTRYLLQVDLKTAEPALIVALRFTGSLADLAGLQVCHFSLWGRFEQLSLSAARQPLPKPWFLIVPDAAPTCAKRYAAVDFLHFARHAHGSTPSSHFTGQAPFSSMSLSPPGGSSATGGLASANAALPKELAGARLIQIKHSQPLTSCSGTFVVEYELSMPMTVCGFVLENCYAAYIALTSTNRLATLLRFIGTSSSGTQDNIGVFRIPNVLVHNGEHLYESPPPAVTFAFPTSNHTLISIMVEVLEWRHVPNTCVGNQSPPHVGKVHFWTSPAVKTRRVVSSASFFSAHSSVSESTILVKKKSTS